MNTDSVSHHVKFTQETVTERMRQAHGDKFDLGEFVCVSSTQKLVIICPIHGEFSIRLYDFLKSEYGCPRCGHDAIGKALGYDSEIFIKLANGIHGERYDYYKVEYYGSTVKVEIICRIHGSFFQQPSLHLQGEGCPDCGHEVRSRKTRKTTEYFIKKSRLVHGEKYDYSEVHYVSAKAKVKIICPDHGAFYQSPNDHTNGKGCNECGNLSRRNKLSLGLEKFIEIAKLIYGDKYDYSKVLYVNGSSKVEIICPEHGSFFQTPNSHTHASHPKGCPSCSLNEVQKRARKVIDDHAILFYEFAKNMEGKSYSYERSIYLGSKVKLEIICPKPGHGSFWQIPNQHLRGAGCPVCMESTGETAVAKVLDAIGIFYEREKTFPDLKDKSLLFVDFYLREYRTCIEFQGGQHFFSVDFFGGEDSFESTQHHDQIKRDWCAATGIKLIEIPYWIDDIESFLLDALNIPTLDLVADRTDDHVTQTNVRPIQMLLPFESSYRVGATP